MLAFVFEILRINVKRLREFFSVLEPGVQNISSYILNAVIFDNLERHKNLPDNY